MDDWHSSSPWAEDDHDHNPSSLSSAISIRAPPPQLHLDSLPQQPSKPSPVKVHNHSVWDSFQTSGALPSSVGLKDDGLGFGNEHDGFGAWTDATTHTITPTTTTTTTFGDAGGNNHGFDNGLGIAIPKRSASASSAGWRTPVGSFQEVDTEIITLQNEGTSQDKIGEDLWAQMDGVQKDTETKSMVTVEADAWNTAGVWDTVGEGHVNDGGMNGHLSPMRSQDMRGETKDYENALGAQRDAFEHFNEPIHESVDSARTLNEDTSVRPLEDQQEAIVINSVEDVDSKEKYEEVQQDPVEDQTKPDQRLDEVIGLASTQDKSNEVESGSERQNSDIQPTESSASEAQLRVAHTHEDEMKQDNEDAGSDFGDFGDFEEEAESEDAKAEVDESQDDNRHKVNSMTGIKNDESPIIGQSQTSVVSPRESQFFNLVNSRPTSMQFHSPAQMRSRPQSMLIKVNRIDPALVMPNLDLLKDIQPLKSQPTLEPPAIEEIISSTSA